MEPNKSKKVARVNRCSLTVLASSIVLALSSNSSLAAEKETEKAEFKTPYVYKKEGKENLSKIEPSKACLNKLKKKCDQPLQPLSISENFKFYDQVACLDLEDPIQTGRLLQLMELRLAEQQLKEDVVVVSECEEEGVAPDVETPVPVKEESDTTVRAGNNKLLTEISSLPLIMTEETAPEGEQAGDGESVIRAPMSGQSLVEKIVDAVDKPAQSEPANEVVDEVTVVLSDPLIENDKSTSKYVDKPRLPEMEPVRVVSGNSNALPVVKPSAKPEKSPAEIIKDKEQERIDRAIARREERKRKLEEAKAKQLGVDHLANLHNRVVDKPQPAIVSKPAVVSSESPVLRPEKKVTELPARSEANTKAHEVLPPVDIAVLPAKPEFNANDQNGLNQDCEACDQFSGRPIAYHVVNSEEDPRIFNFDQGITQRFKSKGAFLDRGRNRDNIVKDKSGREFLNVMAFWDVLVETQDNGEKQFYGNIQFPLGSRHPAIIKNVRSGDQIDQGCKTDEVLVLRSFETEGVDYHHGLVDAYLAFSENMPDGTNAYKEVVRQPAFSLVNVETGCMPKERFSKRDIDPDKMGNDRALAELPVRN